MKDNVDMDKYEKEWKLKNPNSGNILADKDNQKESIDWIKKVVVLYENLMVELADGFEKETGKKLKSPF